MDNILLRSAEALSIILAIDTAREISQQPSSWLKTRSIFAEKKAGFNEWFEPIINTPNLRIIFTGAGTSAYIGDSIAPFLTKETGRHFESISTTDIVSNPKEYFVKTTPTLLVSFARSGDSPESVATITLANQLVDSVYHLVITCNPDSALALEANRTTSSFCLNMPSETLDQSFAMTSSFTSMVVAALIIFADDTEQFEETIEQTRSLLDNTSTKIQALSESNITKVVFLGSGPLKGIAKEASLKLLELSAGKVNCYFESPLGFRHGPKSLIDKSTVVFFLNDSDSHVQKYENDLYNELIKDNKCSNIVMLSDFLNKETKILKGPWLGLTYIVFCQIFAFYKALYLNISPDNPCSNGQVNRVVKGVNIYPY